MFGVFLHRNYSENAVGLHRILAVITLLGCDFILWGER